MLSFNPQVAVALAASAAIALGVPVLLGLVAWRVFRAPAVGWLIGAGTFFVSQVVLRLPWQIAIGVWLQKSHASPTVMWSWLAVSAFTAGLFEETGRFVAYRWLFKDRTARGGVMLGLGHGGLESMLLVGLSLVVNVLLYLALANGQSFGIPEAQRPLVVEQFNALTPGLALAGGVERLSSMAVHVGLSVLVLQVFRRGSKWWLAFAIAFHTLSNLVGVAAAKTLGVWQGEGVIAVFALLALWWTVRFVKTDSSFERSSAVRFPMTIGTAVKWISFVALAVGVLTFPIPILVALQPSVPAPVVWVSGGAGLHRAGGIAAHGVVVAEGGAARSRRAGGRAARVVRPSNSTRRGRGGRAWPRAEGVRQRSHSHRRQRRADGLHRPLPGQRRRAGALLGDAARCSDGAGDAQVGAAGVARCRRWAGAAAGLEREGLISARPSWRWLPDTCDSRSRRRGRCGPDPPSEATRAGPRSFHTGGHASPAPSGVAA